MYWTDDEESAMSLGFRRAIHSTSALLRGRSAFYNIHKKVDDPAKQDFEYFEKNARRLPLDENYIDSLTKLYYEKIGSERDLGLKAADNLISEKETFGLPKVEPTKIRSRYENLDVLEEAPTSVRKIFSVEMASRRELSTEWKNELIKSVRRHSLDTNSAEMKIGWLTALIRHWSLLANDIAQTTPKKPTWLTHRIWLVINERRRLLRILREENKEAFENAIRTLKICYHVPRPVTHVKTRKAWAEAQLRARVEEEKEKRLQELHAAFTQQKAAARESNRIRRESLLRELLEVDRKMEAIGKIEGNVANVVGSYQPSLVSSLSEVVLHSALFYHPKPNAVQR